jgi:hypothetical protein
LGIDDAEIKGQAQRALVRVLRMAVPDASRFDRVFAEALRSAKRTDLPERPDELLRFVRTHVTPQLLKLVQPNLVLALMDDLAVAVEEHQPVPTTSGARRRTPTRVYPVREDAARAPEAQLPVVGIDLRRFEDPPPFPKLQRSLDNLARTASARVPISTPSENRGTPSGFVDRRVSVLLIDPDRLARASLARALVNAKFDVSGLDSTVQVPEAMKGRRERVVAILSARQDSLGIVMRPIAIAHPELPCVAWTETAPAVAKSILAESGVQRYAVVSKAASLVDVVAAIRNFLVELERSTEASDVRADEPRTRQGPRG